SNGIVEGINNRIKMIKRRAFGFQIFERFRLRILVEFAQIH
ncbi:MAG: transposase, partial [Bacteroidota bacterium]